MDPVLAIVVIAYVAAAVVVLYPHTKVPARKARRDSRREALGLTLTQPSAGLQANFRNRPESVRCFAVPALHDLTIEQAREAQRRGECSVREYGRERRAA